MDYNQPKIIQLLNLSTQLFYTNIFFCLWCEKVSLSIKENQRKQIHT